MHTEMLKRMKLSPEQKAAFEEMTAKSPEVRRLLALMEKEIAEGFLETAEILIEMSKIEGMKKLDGQQALAAAALTCQLQAQNLLRDAPEGNVWTELGRLAAEKVKDNT